MVNDSNNHLQYNADELCAPDWMDEQFLQQIVQKQTSEKTITIDKYALTPGTMKNDHYGSIMFRAKVEYSVTGTDGEQTQHRQSLIIKSEPEQEGQKKDLLADKKLFETEIRMYTEILPRFEAILRAHGDQTKLGPSALYHTLSPRKCIVFEDLVERGYATVSMRFFDVHEVQAALRKLAKLHAVSYKLAQDGDALVTSFNCGTFNSIDPEEMPMIRDAVKIFKSVLAQHDDLRAYVPHLERVESKLLSECIAYFNAYGSGVREGIMVLNHGDFHLKNMMIRTSNGQLDDLMLLDYQLSIFGSAAIDVLYSVVMLMSPEMRSKQRDELLQYYFTNFLATLNLIGYTERLPTKAEFEAELHKHRYFELFLTAAFLMVSYLFTDVDGDLTKAVEDESYRLKCFEKPEVLEELRILLPRFLERGYFE